MTPRPMRARHPAILAAAVEVTRERGLEHTSMNDVAERAGTNASSVLYWLASKPELLTIALTAAEESFYRELEAALAKLGSARERMVRLIEAATGWGDYEAALWIDLWSRALRDEEHAGVREQLDERWRRTISAVVAEGQQAGEFGRGDPDELGLLLGALMDGFAVQIALGDQTGTPERARDLCLRVAGRELDCELCAPERSPALR